MLALPVREGGRILTVRAGSGDGEIGPDRASRRVGALGPLSTGGAAGGVVVAPVVATGSEVSRRNRLAGVAAEGEGDSPATESATPESAAPESGSAAAAASVIAGRKSSVHAAPSHHRRRSARDASAYQPGGGPP